MSQLIVGAIVTIALAVIAGGVQVAIARLGKIDTKVEAVHDIVNGERTALRARVEQLANELSIQNLPVPPPTDPRSK